MSVARKYYTILQNGHYAILKETRDIAIGGFLPLFDSEKEAEQGINDLCLAGATVSEVYLSCRPWDSENNTPVTNWEKKYIHGIGLCYVHKLTGKILRIINTSDK